MWHTDIKQDRLSPKLNKHQSVAWYQQKIHKKQPPAAKFQTLANKVGTVPLL